MAGDEAMQRWWDGLNDRQRTQARRAERTGQISDELQMTLRDAGLLKSGEHTLPEDIEIFLKARH